MTFIKAAKKHEMAFIIQILTIFGVVELRQLGQLFSYMSKAAYGEVLSRLRNEGLAYFSADNRFIATSRYSLDRVNTHDSVMAFWVFIKMKNKIEEFCASEPPAILSFNASAKDYDLIPVNEKSVSIVSGSRDSIPKNAIRLLVADCMDTIDAIEARDENDFAVLVDDQGVKQIYKL